MPWGWALVIAISIIKSNIYATVIGAENAFTTKKSKESDVYSYGVILLELITRKRALDPSFKGEEEEEEDIVRWSQSKWRERGEEIENVVDEGLLDELMVDSSIKEQVIGVFLVALKCTEKDPTRRPSMRDVVKQLMDVSSVNRSKKSMLE